MNNKSNPLSDEVKYLRDFFDNAPIGFHVFGPDRKIIDINQAELDMIGYSYEEVVGKKTWVDLIIPEEKILFQRHWEDLNKTGKALNLYYTVVRKDGTRIRVILNATAKFDQSGKIINTRGSIIDVTQKEQAEEALKQKNYALREVLAQIEVEKNQIKDDVLANVENLILPVLMKLQRRGTALDRKNIILLEEKLKELTSGFGREIGHRRWDLTPREIEICDLIKSGQSTKEMADLLRTSRRTIENHRNNIRKKLAISQKDINLTSYLQALKDKRFTLSMPLAQG